MTTKSVELTEIEPLTPLITTAGQDLCRGFLALGFVVAAWLA
jgi:hypothetical protein